MGNSTSLLQVAQPLAPEWVHEKDEHYCSILKNIQTSQQAEQYIVATLKPIQQQLEIYEHRYHQKSSLVSTLAVEKRGTLGFCNNSKQLLVTIQRIPRRLSEVSNLRLEQSVSILYSSLQGYKVIFEKTGYVEVTAEMIGFNQQNTVKVWLNQNYAKNHSEHQYEDSKESYIVFTMISEIMKAISQHSSQSFKQVCNIVEKAIVKNPSFQQAIKAVEAYIRAKSMNLPNKLSLLSSIPIKHQSKVEIFHPKETNTKHVSMFASQVFAVNAKQPNIRQTINSSKGYFQNQSIRRDESPIQTLNKVKSESNIHSLLSANYIHSKPQPVYNISYRQQPKIFNSIGIRSPSINKVQTIPITYQQAIPKPNRSIDSQFYTPVDHKIIHKSPEPRLKTIQSSNTSVSHVSCKIESPVFKLLPRSPKLSQFSNIKSSETSKIQETSKPQNSLQTTGQFKQLQIIEDAISEQASSNSHRIHPYIPLIPINSHSEKQNAEIISAAKSDLENLEIKKSTAVLVDKALSNQVIESNRNQSSVVQFKIEKLKNPENRQEERKIHALTFGKSKFYEKQNESVNLVEEKNSKSKLGASSYLKQSNFPLLKASSSLKESNFALFRSNSTSVLYKDLKNSLYL